MRPCYRQITRDWRGGPNQVVFAVKSRNQPIPARTSTYPQSAFVEPQSCPNCTYPGRFLEEASAGTTVNYYRCDLCSCVWCIDKGDPKSPPSDVMRPVADRRLVRRDESAGLFSQRKSPEWWPAGDASADARAGRVVFPNRIQKSPDSQPRLAVATILIRGIPILSELHVPGPLPRKGQRRRRRQLLPMSSVQLHLVPGQTRPGVTATSC